MDWFLYDKHLRHARIITYFTLAFSLIKLFLFVMMEYALLNKGKLHFPYSLFVGDSYSVGIGQNAWASYLPTQILPLFRLYVSKKTLVIHYFLPPF